MKRIAWAALVTAAIGTGLHWAGGIRTAQGESEAEPEQPPLWGALAIETGQGTAWGWAIDAPSLQEAERHALAQCGGNCGVVMRFNGQCAAMAAGKDGDAIVFGWAKDPYEHRARNMAVNACAEKGGSLCMVQVAGCTSR
ncbi:MAG: DUF4189 domain-containing protein [Gemmatimonadota bacterium]|nr:DUF4189 domain-containing protein [Gemmatimonadota bacterium]